MISKRYVSLPPGSSLNGAVYAQISVNLVGDNEIKSVNAECVPSELPSGSPTGSKETYLLGLTMAADRKSVVKLRA